MSDGIDGAKFRQLMGSYPTGANGVSAMTGDDRVALEIGWFVSLTLDPTLVGFLPGKTSCTWPLSKAQGRSA